MNSQGRPWQRLPDAPGVYFFLSGSKILYIGRATSLRDRVRSYFADDVIQTRGPLIVDMVFQSSKIDFVQTDSVLEAVILEANLIKKYQPHYNTKEKSDKSFHSIVITQEIFPRVLVMRSKDLEGGDFKKVFGPYTNPSVLRAGLKILRKIFPFRDRCLPGQGKPCFNRQIGLCPGVCSGEISVKEYSVIISQLSLFLEGKKAILITKLQKEMQVMAKLQKFESAHQIKQRLFALEHIQDISLVREDETIHSKDSDLEAQAGLFRIEGYDVAHLSGRNVVGVMTVLEDQQIKRSDYRLFRIRQAGDPIKTSDDLAYLKEILTRRLKHSEWPYPNLIVVDGAKAQKSVAEAVLKAQGFDIAVVAVVKNKAHKPDRIMAASAEQDLIKKYSKEILLVNSEAHRFAIKYHRKLRGAIKKS